MRANEGRLQSSGVPVLTAVEQATTLCRKAKVASWRARLASTAPDHISGPPSHDRLLGRLR